MTLSVLFQALFALSVAVHVLGNNNFLTSVRSVSNFVAVRTVKSVSIILPAGMSARRVPSHQLCGGMETLSNSTRETFSGIEKTHYDLLKSQYYTSHLTVSCAMIMQSKSLNTLRIMDKEFKSPILPWMYEQPLDTIQDSHTAALDAWRVTRQNVETFNGMMSDAFQYRFNADLAAAKTRISRSDFVILQGKVRVGMTQNILYHLFWNRIFMWTIDWQYQYLNDMVVKKSSRFEKFPDISDLPDASLREGLLQMTLLPLLLKDEEFVQATRDLLIFVFLKALNKEADLLMELIVDEQFQDHFVNFLRNENDALNIVHCSDGMEASKSDSYNVIQAMRRLVSPVFQVEMTQPGTLVDVRSFFDQVLEALESQEARNKISPLISHRLDLFIDVSFLLQNLLERVKLDETFFLDLMKGLVKMRPESELTSMWECFERVLTLVRSGKTTEKMTFLLKDNLSPEDLQQMWKEIDKEISVLLGGHSFESMFQLDEQFRPHNVCRIMNEEAKAKLESARLKKKLKKQRLRANKAAREKEAGNIPLESVEEKDEIDETESSGKNGPESSERNIENMEERNKKPEQEPVLPENSEEKKPNEFSNEQEFETNSSLSELSLVAPNLERRRSEPISQTKEEQRPHPSRRRSSTSGKKCLTLDLSLISEETSANGKITLKRLNHAASFRILFGLDSGNLKWHDFVQSISAIGFSMKPSGGSSFRFERQGNAILPAADVSYGTKRPEKDPLHLFLNMKKSFNLHRPHPDATLKRHHLIVLRYRLEHSLGLSPHFFDI